MHHRYHIYITSNVYHMHHCSWSLTAQAIYKYLIVSCIGHTPKGTDTKLTGDAAWEALTKDNADEADPNLSFVGKKRDVNFRVGILGLLSGECETVEGT